MGLEPTTLLSISLSSEEELSSELEPIDHLKIS